MSRTIVVAAIATLVACGGTVDTTDGVMLVDGFTVSEAWTRPTPPGVSDAAIYVSIENRDAPDDRFIGSASDDCVAMHPHLTTIDDEGVAAMNTADDDQLGLPTGGRLDMLPTGLHVMCLGLRAPLELDDSFEVELRFSEHEPVTVPVVVTNR